MSNDTHGGGLYKLLAEAKTQPPKAIKWRVQTVAPRDHFETCTLTVEQWLEGSESDGLGLRTPAQKWEALMAASVLAAPGVAAQDGLRQSPRIGYDPRRDQLFFIFKASNNGTTLLVSPLGIDMGREELAGPAGCDPLAR